MRERERVLSFIPKGREINNDKSLLIENNLILEMGLIHVYPK